MMKFILKGVDFLVFSNLYVAVSVAALTHISLMFRKSQNWQLILFVFSATVFVYNFIRLIRIDKQILIHSSERHKRIFENKWLLWVLSIISLLLAAFGFHFIYHDILAWVLMLSFISLFYAVPVIRHRGYLFMLREIPHLKLFLISFVWAFVTEGLVSLLVDDHFNILMFFERLFFVAAITIPFDIRDLSYDSKKIGTLPIVYGVNKAKSIAIVFVLIAESLCFYQYWFLQEYSFCTFLAMYIVYETSVFMIYRTQQGNNERFFTVLIEGLPLLLIIMISITKIKAIFLF